MRRFVETVLRVRWGVLVLCVGLSLASLASLGRARIASSVADLFLGDSPAYRAFLRDARRFGNDEIGFFVIPARSLLSGRGQARFGQVRARIESLPEVASVRSILDVPRVRGEAEALEVETWADAVARSRLDLEAALEGLAADPMVAGTLLSRDRKDAAVLVELRPDPKRPAEHLDALVASILDAFDAAGWPRETVRRAGPIVVLSEVMQQAEYALRTIFPASALVLLVTVWLLFGRLWPSLLSLGIALLGVLWTMGLAVAIDPKISILMATVPAVVLIVSFSDVVHLCSAYLIELEGGQGKADAIRAAAMDVGRACLYTSLTTFVGFVSLSFIPTRAFRLLGLVLGFGVAVALLLAVTLTPIAFHLLPRPDAFRARRATRGLQGLLDRLLAGVRRAVARWPGWVVAGFSVLAVVSAFGTLRLHMETRFSERLAESNRVRQDERYLQRAFGGSNLLEVYVDAGEAGGLLRPEVMHGIARLAARARSQPEVAAVYALTDLLARLHAALDPKASTALPQSREGIAQELLLFELAGGEDLERLVDGERRRTHLSVRLSDEGFRVTSEVGRRLEALAVDLFPPGVRVWAAGHTLLFGRWLDDVIRGQRRGLGLSLLTISLMMVVALRSLRLGLGSMIPNVLPLLVLGGWVSLAWQAVDTDTMMVAMLAIGIGVDDTIHFLVRYRVERGRGASREAAIERTFLFAGRAIVMTTVILVAGFLPFATSDYFSTRLFGTLLPMVLIVALVSDLLLLPALLRLGVLGGP